MEGFSFIMPCDVPRIPHLLNTIAAYSHHGVPDNVEFIIISRTLPDYINVNSKIRIIHYNWEGPYFSSSLPINIGIRNAKYPNIIVTSPEVAPITNVLQQLSSLERGNYVCQVFDEAEDGSTSFSLVNTDFRAESPAMYFLACFKKEDLEFINGWDEDFMGTYAFEDNDFGARFVRAGLKFTVRDDILGLHQYHPRGSMGADGGASRRLYEMNNTNGVIRPKNGLLKE